MICDKGLSKSRILILAIILISAAPVFSQDNAPGREEFWICPGAEVAMYSISNAAYGGGLSFGYGRRAAIGLKAAYFFDLDKEVDSLELNLLLRWYFFPAAPSAGPFIQLNAGPVFFFQDKDFPSTLGVVSAGLNLGWRFLLGRYWFIEGAIRGGYPYIAGAQLSAGLRF